MRLCSKYTQKRGLLHRILNQQYSDVIFGIILSNISQIILPYKYVLWDLSFPNFSNKVNQSLQILLFGLVLIFLSFMIAFIAVKSLKLTKLQKNKENSTSILAKKQKTRDK